MDGETLSDYLEDSDFGGHLLSGVAAAASPDDIFSILDAFESVSDIGPVTTLRDETSLENVRMNRLVSQKSITSSSSSAALQELLSENDDLYEQLAASSPSRKRQKLIMLAAANNPLVTEASIPSMEEGPHQHQQTRMSHITVERNRRKQMNDHLSVLRSLMPSFYVKRGDQASIIGGVVDYISELQQVLQSLEAKKQRKVYTEVLASPRLNNNNNNNSVSSPRMILPSPLTSPRKPPLSPRMMSLPVSPRTPQPSSPYKPAAAIRLPQQPAASATSPSSSTSSTNIMSDHNNMNNELIANSKSAVADVEVKFTGSNVLLKTVSPPLPGQALKIISALHDLSLEILHVNISTVDETMLNSFTVKIGIECQLSADEIAKQVQQTFS